MPVHKMSKVSQTSESHQSGGMGQYVSTNDNPTLQITTVKLDGLNYLAWPRSATLYIKSKWKIGYLTGKVTESAVNDPSYDKWD